MLGPNPNDIHPNPNIPSVCYIKNTVTRPTIIVGDYTYYDDPVDSEHFELHVTHHYDFIGDKLIIGKFCAIGKGVEFIMNGAIIGCAVYLPIRLTSWAEVGKRALHRRVIYLSREILLLATMYGLVKT